MDYLPMLTAAAISAWMLLLLEGVVLLGLLRQIGVLHNRLAPRGLYDARHEGPRVGQPAPAIPVVTITGRELQLAAPRPFPMVQIFVSSTCSLCRDVLEATPAFYREFRGRVEASVLVKGELADALRLARTHRLPEEVPIIPTTTVFEAYAIETTPWLIVLDANGVVLSSGLVNNLEQMEVAVERALTAQPDERARGVISMEVGAQR